MSAILFIGWVVQVLIWLIIIEAIVSNMIAFRVKFVSPYHPFVKLLRSVVNPVLDPIRRLIPPYKTSNWDLSPLVAILALQLIMRFLYSALR